MKRDPEPDSETYAQKLARLLAEHEALKKIPTSPVLTTKLNRLRSRIKTARAQAEKRPDEPVEFRAVHEPTEEEIVAGCLEHQATWTEADRRNRLGQRQKDEGGVSGVKVVDILAHNGGRRKR
jgi:hypothetical protein